MEPAVNIANVTGDLSLLNDVLGSTTNMTPAPAAAGSGAGGTGGGGGATLDSAVVIPALERKIRRLKKQSRRSKRQIAQLEEELGEQYFLTGQYERARDILTDALNVYVTLQDTKCEAYVTSCIANCHFKLRVFSSAKDMYMRSLECSRELGDVVSELKDTYNVALCDSRLGKWAEASNWLDKASRLAASCEEETEQLMGFVHCAAGFVKQGQCVYRDAVGRYREGLAVLGDDPALAYFATTNLGICYDKMGQLDAAKKEFGEALAIAQATDRPLRDKLRALFHLAMVLLQQDQPLEAMELLHEAERCEQLLHAAQKQEKEAGGGNKGPRYTKGLEPSCSFLRSTISAYLAQLTLTCEARVAHMVQPVLDRVLEYCDAASAAAAEKEERPAVSSRSKQQQLGDTGKGLGETQGIRPPVVASGGHAMTMAMVLNTRAILQAIEGEPEEALQLMGQMRKLLDDNKLDPPPLPATFLPDVWAQEAVTWPIEDATIRSGTARNIRIYQRRGLGLGSLGEAGTDGSSVAQVKKALAAIKASMAPNMGLSSSGGLHPFGRDHADSCVSEMQMAYCLRVIQEEAVAAAAAAAGGNQGGRGNNIGISPRNPNQSVIASPRGPEGAAGGNRSMALVSLENALYAAKQKDDKVLIAASLRCLSDLHREEGDTWEELRLLKQHEHIVRDFKDQGWYADCCRRLISVYTRISNLPPPGTPRMAQQSDEGEETGDESEDSTPTQLQLGRKGGRRPTSDEPDTLRRKGGQGRADGSRSPLSVGDSDLVSTQSTLTMSLASMTITNKKGGPPRRAGMLLQSHAARLTGGLLTYEQIEQRGAGIGPGDEVWVYEHSRQLASFYLQVYRELQGLLGWYFRFRS